MVDNGSAGRQAATHLVEIGCNILAYVGIPQITERRLVIARLVLLPKLIIKHKTQWKPNTVRFLHLSLRLFRYGSRITEVRWLITMTVMTCMWAIWFMWTANLKGSAVLSPE